MTTEEVRINFDISTTRQRSYLLHLTKRKYFISINPLVSEQTRLLVRLANPCHRCLLGYYRTPSVTTGGLYLNSLKIPGERASSSVINTLNKDRVFKLSVLASF